MSASDFMFRHRYGHDGRRRPAAFGAVPDPARSAADQFVSRARTSSRVLCPSCRIGDVVQETNADGDPTGRFSVVVAVPADDPRIEGQLAATAATLASAAGAGSSSSPAITTVVGGRPVKLISLLFWPLVTAQI